ncbi:MAG: polyprenyl synthetase family protein [bacterium]|nr:polyprenyl synthetase family protein [bacterium]
MTLDTTLTQLSEQIDHDLRVLIDQQAAYVADFSGYFFGWLDQSFQPTSQVQRGKRLRPILTLLICQAISGDTQRAMPLALAIELIHNYSLIHDDIADRDEERRGRPTVWKLVGDGLAINTGSVLYTLAYQVITTLDAPAERILEVHKKMVQTSIRLSEGQHWDITYERSLKVDEGMYLNMIEGKTAALLEFAAWGGAFLATEEEAVIDAYRRFGLHLGLAFQIRDDALSIWGDSKVTGKPPFSDLRNKKKSLPVTYAFSRLEGEALSRFQALYVNVEQHMTEGEIQEALRLLEQVGAQGYTQQLADFHTSAALRALDAADQHSPAQAGLQALAQQLLGRVS